MSGRGLEFHFGFFFLGRFFDPFDLDILLYDDLVVDQDGLRLPRDEIVEQAFVLRPLADIAGDAVHPVLQKSYADLLDMMRQNQPDSVTALIRHPLFD